MKSCDLYEILTLPECILRKYFKNRCEIARVLQISTTADCINYCYRLLKSIVYQERTIQQRLQIALDNSVQEDTCLFKIDVDPSQRPLIPVLMRIQDKIQKRKTFLIQKLDLSLGELQLHGKMLEQLAEMNAGVARELKDAAAETPAIQKMIMYLPLIQCRFGIRIVEKDIGCHISA